MSRSSWHHLREENPAWRLPDHLRARDPLAAVDCGWVDQMIPFLEMFSSVGDRVLDPFAGFGSTLIACAVTDRSGTGIEIDPGRVALIRERLTDQVPTANQTVIWGDARNTRLEPASVDLVLTNLPYYGGRVPGEAEGQLYSAESYERYLEMMESAFCHLSTVLVPDGFLIAMIENVRLGARFLPQAWDIAARLGKHLRLEDEHILCYEKRETGTGDPGTTNRGHEYALVARNRVAGILIEETLALLRALQERMSFVVIGSLAVHLLAPDLLARPPADADLWCDDSAETLDGFRAFFAEQGFGVFSWDLPLDQLPGADFLEGRGYLRAVRTRPSGERLIVDATYGREIMSFDDHRALVVDCAGLTVAQPAVLMRWLRARGRQRDLDLAAELEARFRGSP